MARKPNPYLIDEDNPELTADDFARMRPAREVLPPALVDELTKKRGRPKAEHAKALVTLRIDPDVLEAFKATGAGWQTRMNAALKSAASKIKRRA